MEKARRGKKSQGSKTSKALTCVARGEPARKDLVARGNSPVNYHPQIRGGKKKKRGGIFKKSASKRGKGVCGVCSSHN